MIMKKISKPTTEEITKKFEDLVTQNNYENIINFIKELIEKEVPSCEIFLYLDKYYYSPSEDNPSFKQALIMLRDDGTLHKLFNMDNSSVAIEIVAAYIDRSDNLDLNDKKLTELPSYVCYLHKLKTLNLTWNQLTSLPESISHLKQLEKLDLYHNDIAVFPESICLLPQLSELNLNNNQLTQLYKDIGQLQQLQKLYLQNNQLISLPESICHLRQLIILDLGYNQLSILPESIDQLQQLIVLNLNENQLTTLPDNIGQLHSLQIMDLDGNKIPTLPDNIVKLQPLPRSNYKPASAQLINIEIPTAHDIKSLDIEQIPKKHYEQTRKYNFPKIKSAPSKLEITI